MGKRLADRVAAIVAVDARMRRGYLYRSPARQCPTFLNRDDPMRLNRPVPALILSVATALAAACTKPVPASVKLQADSIWPVARMTFAGGQTNAECGFIVNAVADGPSRTSATLVRGLVIYTLEQSHDTIMKRPVAGKDVALFFDGKTTVEAGSKITSRRQAISMSQPVVPMRGFVTFDYTTKDSKDTLTTPAFTFICR